MTLPELVDRLEAAGATVPKSTQYRAALAAVEVPREPVIPDNLLDLDPAAIENHLRARAAHHVLVRDSHRHAHPIHQAITAQMIEAMRPHLDDFLDALRPDFTRAAITARTVTAAGVRAGMNAEDVVALGADAVIAWSQFRDGPAPRILAETTAARITIARVWDVAEGATGDHAVGITWPWRRNGLEPARPFEPSWDRWLDLADDLDLVPLADLDPDDVHQARGGVPFDDLRAHWERLGSTPPDDHDDALASVSH